MLAFSRDGKLLASVSRDRTARIWNAITGQPLCALTTPNDHLYGVAFSPDSQYLLVDDVGGKSISEGEHHSIAVWEVSSNLTAPKEIGIVGGHREDIWCLKFSPDGKRLASGSNDGTVKIWPWDATNVGQAQVPICSLPVRLYGFGDCVAFSPNGERLFTAAEEHTIKVWDAQTGDALKALSGHTGDVVAVAISPDGRWLASAGEDTTIVIWDARNLSNSIPNLSRQHTLRGHTGMVMSLAFSPDSRWLVSGSRDHTVKVWDVSRLEVTPDR